MEDNKKYTMKDFLDGKFYVAVNNEEEELSFLKICEELAIKWSSGQLPMGIIISKEQSNKIFPYGMKIINNKQMVWSPNEHKIYKSINYTEFIDIYNEYKKQNKKYTIGDFINGNIEVKIWGIIQEKNFLEICTKHKLVWEHSNDKAITFIPSEEVQMLYNPFPYFVKCLDNHKLTWSDCAGKVGFIDFNDLDLLQEKKEDIVSGNHNDHGGYIGGWKLEYPKFKLYNYGWDYIVASEELDNITFNKKGLLKFDMKYCGSGYSLDINNCIFMKHIISGIYEYDILTTKNGKVKVALYNKKQCQYELVPINRSDKIARLNIGTINSHYFAKIGNLLEKENRHYIKEMKWLFENADKYKEAYF